MPSEVVGVSDSSENDSLVYSWQPPSYSGGLNITIDFYEVTVSPPSNTGECARGSCSVRETNITLTGLTCQSYNITIKPVNCVGIGPCYFRSVTASKHNNEKY